MTDALTAIREARRRLYQDDCRLARIEAALLAGDDQAGELLEDYCRGPLYIDARELDRLATP